MLVLSAPASKSGLGRESAALGDLDLREPGRSAVSRSGSSTTAWDLRADGTGIKLLGESRMEEQNARSRVPTTAAQGATGH